MREYRYWLLDVFTETALAGNQLAVFLNGAGLGDAEMQAIALEMNLSETTFCFPDEQAAEPGEQDRGPGVRVRIFTTEEELPFAGHPTLGTATALRLTVPALQGTAEVVLRLPAGPVPVRFGVLGTGEAELPFGRPVQGEMEQPLPRFGQWHDREAVASALGLPLAALDRDKGVQTVSTGMPFVVVPLVTLEALGSLQPARVQPGVYLRGTDGKWFYPIAPAGEGGTHWRARMPLYGGEDPATGSAAGCATAYLVRHGFAPPGTPLLIEQGVEMGRPSRLHTRAVLWGEGTGARWDAGSYVRVGGSTVPVAEGRFFLP